MCKAPGMLCRPSLRRLRRRPTTRARNQLSRRRLKISNANAKVLFGLLYPLSPLWHYLLDIEMWICFKVVAKTVAGLSLLAVRNGGNESTRSGVERRLVWHCHSGCTPFFGIVTLFATHGKAPRLFVPMIVCPRAHLFSLYGLSCNHQWAYLACLSCDVQIFVLIVNPVVYAPCDKRTLRTAQPHTLRLLTPLGVHTTHGSRIPHIS
jgi:hypothetical protein